MFHIIDLKKYDSKTLFALGECISEVYKDRRIELGIDWDVLQELNDISGRILLELTSKERNADN